jgi:hypothetical protein
MKVPSFSETHELVRYVLKKDRLGGNRTSVAAYLDVGPTGDPTKEHLSVNSLEVESYGEIASYCQERFQKGRGEVALSSTKVRAFNLAGKRCGVDLVYNASSLSWQFVGNRGLPENAYKHRPVIDRDNARLNSPSHCGVEFVRAMADYAKTRFARRLGGKRYHLVKI